ncbi:hypothetical protein MKW92_030525 [Papaver armeniacum]|nr:hypothetical protein MKW92_030525 [Papaver armeniacum]
MVSSLLFTSSPSFLNNREFNSRFKPLKPNLKQHLITVRALKETTKETKTNDPSSPEEITQKFGLEAGLWKIFSSKGEEESGEKTKGEQAKELLTKYGGAYLATSITLSLISFTLLCANKCRCRCSSITAEGKIILYSVGISASETGEKVGTFALAYAAHKAASPIRFPPTVALTPVVAGWIEKIVGKDK